MAATPIRSSVTRAGLAALVAALALPAGGAGATKFPGATATITSPSGRLVIRNVDSDAEPHHTLYLKDGSGAERKLLSYDRHVSVLWAPNERAVVVNDFAGSDYSVCRLFLVESGREIEVSEAITTKYGGDGTVFANHHVYFEGVGWQGPETLKVKVWGYGDRDPKGFSRFFTYRLDATVERTYYGPTLL